MPCQLPSCLKVGIDPVLTHLGPFPLYWYGLLVALGFVLAIRLGLREAERAGLDPDQVLSAMLVAALFGLLGARLYYVLQNRPGYYFSLDHIGEALSLWQGGLAFFGGIFGAAIGGWLYCNRYNLPSLRVLDVGALVAPLGQAVGRIGNVINGDLPGLPTKGYGVEYTNAANPLVPLDRIGRTVQPVAIYDAIWELAVFGILLFTLRRDTRSGDTVRPGRLTGLYLALFALGQLALYSFRSDPVVFAGLKQAQLTALPVIAVGVWLYLTAQPLRGPAAAAPRSKLADAGTDS